MSRLVSRETVLRTMRIIGAAGCQCPAHSHAYSAGNAPVHSHDTSSNKEYAIEMAMSNIRYGAGVTAEVGMDVINMGAKKVVVFTDKNLMKLPPVAETIKSLERSGVQYSIFDDVRVEPNDQSWQKAIDFVKKEHGIDAFVAVGGGSVIDTCKAANLLMCHPENTMIDFIAAPIGKGAPVKKELKPLIAIPTTAGTGSETTGVAVLDWTPLGAKAGIGNRALRPTLGLVDPLHVKHMPSRVTANSGFDVFCHALESYTAIPYLERSPRPTNPSLRPSYQGSNPISDVWSMHAFRQTAKYLKRAVEKCDDFEARSEMHLASAFAGIGFGNAGVHLCHGCSYAISGLVKEYFAKDYPADHAIVPHGLSVIITAPAVFKFTAPSCPERHLEAAEVLGADISNAKRVDAGPILADQIKQFMYDLGVDNGISAFGFKNENVDALVKGTIPNERVTKLAPAGEPTPDELHMIFEDSLTNY